MFFLWGHHIYNEFTMNCLKLWLYNGGAWKIGDFCNTYYHKSIPWWNKFPCLKSQHDMWFSSITKWGKNLYLANVQNSIPWWFAYCTICRAVNSKARRSLSQKPIYRRIMVVYILVTLNQGNIKHFFQQKYFY